MQNWVDMFAPFIKSQDPNHMVRGASFWHTLDSKTVSDALQQIVSCRWNGA